MKGGNEANAVSGITHRQALRLPSLFNHKEHKELSAEIKKRSEEFAQA